MLLLCDLMLPWQQRFDRCGFRDFVLFCYIYKKIKKTFTVLYNFFRKKKLVLITRWLNFLRFSHDLNKSRNPKWRLFRNNDVVAVLTSYDVIIPF